MLSPVPTIHDHVARDAETGPWPVALDAVLSVEMAQAAAEETGQWPGYASTPLHALDSLAAAYDLSAVSYKDEGQRLGLGSFKALGGAYAVLCLAAERVGADSLAAVRGGQHRQALADMTVATATDGNHGRSVAWGARMAGCACRIYIHAQVSLGRQRAIEALGAEVVRIDGDYDASVRRCAEHAAARGWTVVSDTSYDGYREIPRLVMAGYSVLASELLSQLAGRPPTHLFVQAGVGGLAAAVAARLWQGWGARRPRIVVVEPTRAACLTATARAGKPTSVPFHEETVMAGLSCGEVSLLAWDVLARAAGDFVTIDDAAVGAAMRLLADGQAGGGPIVAGESAVPGLIALVAAAADPELRHALGLSSDSRVLLLGCEGATDPEIYRRMVGTTADRLLGR
jgi:diaminopropionate ammonia-lyase